MGGFILKRSLIMVGIVFLNLLVGLAGCVYLTFFSLQSVPKGGATRS